MRSSKALMLIGLFCCSACGRALVNGPDPNEAIGTYALVSYNGANLPTNGIASGAMQLFADHYAFTYSGPTCPSPCNGGERGTWQMNAKGIVLQGAHSAIPGPTFGTIWPDWTGSINQTTISMNAGGANNPPMVFVR